MKLRQSALAVAAALGTFAYAQQAFSDPSQEVEVFGGASFGDRIVDRPAAGRALRLDDDATFGVRYTFWTGNRLGLQLAGSATPTTIKYTQGGDTDVDVYSVDANLLFDLAPELVLGGHKVQTYAALGAGYTWANADNPIVGTVGAATKTLDDDGGFSANAGLGAKFYFRDDIYAGLDARYRYIDKLVKNDGRDLSTVQATLSIGYRF
jgi:hypothetical protein